MTASITVRQRTPHGQAWRRLVARHPVATFLLLVFSVSVAVACVPVLTRHDMLPFDLALYDSLGPVLGVALPAFVVVAVAGGREGVRELGSRCLRWRVGLRWYAFAFSECPGRGVVVRRRRVRSAAARGAGGPLDSAVHGSRAAVGAADHLLHRGRGGRLHGVPAGQVAEPVRSVEGQPAGHGPIRRLPPAQPHGRVRARAGPAPSGARLPRRFGGAAAVRAGGDDVAVQRDREQRAAGRAVARQLRRHDVGLRPHVRHPGCGPKRRGGRLLDPQRRGHGVRRARRRSHPRAIGLPLAERGGATRASAATRGWNLELRLLAQQFRTTGEGA